MKSDINEIMFQTCNLALAMVRNINDNFYSVSFQILDNRDIQVKIILLNKTDIEEEYIGDMSAELSSMQDRDNVMAPEIEIGIYCRPLENLVYIKG